MDQKVKSGREDFVPQGYYTLFKMTLQEIFGTEPDEKVLRQIIYIGNYLEIFVWLLQKKHKLDIDRAKDITLAFIRHLFASPVIRKNHFGKYRYYITKAFLRFANKRMRILARQDELKLTAGQRFAMLSNSVEDFVQDRILNIELRQIRRALEEGVIDEYMSHGLTNGELSERDVLIWHLSVRCHLTRREIVQCREIADSREFVTADTVKNTLRKVEEYFKRHAREVRFLLREL